jgi:lipopolysaccharide transport system permease protein
MELAMSGDNISKARGANVELVYRLVLRNLNVKYQRSALGFLWTLIHPAVMAAVIITVFTQIVRIPVEQYWAFLISGFFVWNFLAQCINVGSLVLAEHANLVRSIAVSKELLIISAVLSRLVEFLIELAIVLVILAVFRHQGVPLAFVILPILIVLQTALAVGLALPIAAISVFYQDVQNALPALLLALFYLSPIFYPATLIPEGARSVYMLNPIAQMMVIYHAVIYGGEFPSLLEFGVLTFTIFVIAGLGYLFFLRRRDAISEIL